MTNKKTDTWDRKLDGDCPHCGRCKHCGRGGFQTQPYYPVPYRTIPDWTWRPWESPFYVTGGFGQGGTTTIGG